MAWDSFSLLSDHAYMMDHSLLMSNKVSFLPMFDLIIDEDHLKLEQLNEKGGIN